MKPEILEYLKSKQVGVLAVEMLDCSPHAATVHFANSENPLVFFFETCKEYRKSEALFGRRSSRASFVVGTDESATKTLQLDGLVELIGPEEKDTFDSIYFAKFANKKEKMKDPKFVFFKFTPTWWRFTDWKSPQGKLILTSE